MKRSEYGKHTRGQWKKRELVMAVLAVLRANQYQGGLPLTADRIHQFVGCNRGSLFTHLKKWCYYEYILRSEGFKPSGYSILPKGNSYFEAVAQGFLSRRKGEWVYVDVRALLRRLPGFQTFRGGQSRLNVASLLRIL